MGKISDAAFKGASGEKYGFQTFTMDSKFEIVGAVYVYTKRTETDGRGVQKFLFIGQTRRLEDAMFKHEKWQCLEFNGVNCVCIHLDEDEASRMKKEEDLLNANKTPCNE